MSIFLKFGWWRRWGGEHDDEGDDDGEVDTTPSPAFGDVEEALHCVRLHIPSMDRCNGE